MTDLRQSLGVADYASTQWRERITGALATVLAALLTAVGARLAQGGRAFMRSMHETRRVQAQRELDRFGLWIEHDGDTASRSERRP